MPFNKFRTGTSNIRLSVFLLKLEFERGKIKVLVEAQVFLQDLLGLLSPWGRQATYEILQILEVVRLGIAFFSKISQAEICQNRLAGFGYRLSPIFQTGLAR